MEGSLCVFLCSSNLSQGLLAKQPSTIMVHVYVITINFYLHNIQVIKEQYPSYSLEGNIVSFTQPIATLDYSFEPAAGWLIKHADMIQYVSDREPRSYNLIHLSHVDVRGKNRLLEGFEPSMFW